MHILCGKYVGITHTELSHCPVTEHQWDYVLSVHEERGGKQLFLKYQSSTDIFIWSSSCSQTSFPTIIWPILVLWKLIPKIEFNSVEFNCSIVFPEWRLTLVFFGLLTGSSPSGFWGAPRGEHLSIRVRSYHDQLHGPIRFPQHLFSVHDHGRQRSGKGPQHTFHPYVGLTVHWAISVRRSTTGLWPSR